MISKTKLGLRNHVSIPAGHNRLPIEITIIGKFPAEAAKQFVDLAFQQQAIHPAYVEEFNETSALIGKPTFSNGPLADDPTAVYTFGVDTRDLVFHRHEGHRAIIGISGKAGCFLRFSLCTPEEAEKSPLSFLEKTYVVRILGGRMFSLRFNGTIYHQFSPMDPSEKAFFAASVHTNEPVGLSGALLEKVLIGEGSIPLLTQPASEAVINLLNGPDPYKHATFIDVDCLDEASF